MAQTPVAKVKKSALRDKNSFSPFSIPPSPAMTILGCGTGVNVYRFLRTSQEGQSPWAVKKVTKRARPGISERLALEASILKTLKHPNIVGFRALAGSKDGDLCLAMEDCHMSLRDLIDEKEFLQERFTYKEVLKFAWSIAKALDYLHNEKKILHGDIKSGNILIRGNFEAVKLCDFGVALKLKDDLSCIVGSPKRYVGSEPWKSREALTQDSGGRVCDKTDIFAYGLTIWEMLTLNVPHVDLLDTGTSTEGMTSEDEEKDSEEYLAALGTRPPLSKENFDKSFEPVIELFYCCSDEDLNKRPSSKQVVDTLRPHSLELNIEHF